MGADVRGVETFCGGKALERLWSWGCFLLCQSTEEGCFLHTWERDSSPFEVFDFGLEFIFNMQGQFDWLLCMVVPGVFNTHFDKQRLHQQDQGESARERNQWCSGLLAVLCVLRLQWSSLIQ